MTKKSKRRDDTFSFKGPVADVIGIPKALLLKEIAYWRQHNEDKSANFRDGFFWMYNTADAFATHFYFLKAKSIERWLKEMARDGIIFRQAFNKNRGDRVYWYRENAEFYDGCMTGTIIDIEDWTIPQNEECRTLENEGTIPQNEECRTLENEESYTTSTNCTQQLEPRLGDAEDRAGVSQGILFVDDDPATAAPEKKKVPRKKKSAAEYRAEADDVLTFLNVTAGRKYATGDIQGAEANRRLVVSLLKRKYTVDQLKDLITMKVFEWNDKPKSRVWVRPSTLFGSKAERYLDEVRQATEDPKFAQMFIDAKAAEANAGGYTPDTESVNQMADLENW